MTKLLPVVIVLLAVPLIGIALVLWARRSSAMPRLPAVLVLSGAAGVVLTAFFAFAASTVPIAPYETSPGAWRPILWQFLVFAYIGFGLGVVVAAIGALPVLLIRVVRRRRRLRQGAPPAGGDDRDKSD